MAPLNSTKPEGDQVLIEEKSNARILTLNRPRQLNALSFQMFMLEFEKQDLKGVGKVTFISAHGFKVASQSYKPGWVYQISQLLELFVAYEEDSNVNLVIVKGKGRAFCAGGDVAAVVSDIFFDRSTTFDKVQPLLIWNHLLLRLDSSFNFLVSILNGIVMGGGAGASIHGRFRVATENSVFAMPETALGLFPDVGASYFLSRLPGFFGEYVGLMGTRLDAAEMLACGLATHFVPTARLSLLEEVLHKVDSSDPSIISAIIDEYSQKPYLKEQSAYHRLDVIDRCFSRRTVEEILSALEREALNTKDDWISATIQSLKGASPMSLKISLRLVREQKANAVSFSA